MHMFRRLFARLAAALLVLLPPNSAMAQSDAAVRPALWKVADGDTTIYLFGTVHVLPAGIDWYGGKVAQAYAASDELVTEIAGENTARMQAIVGKTALLPGGQTLRGMLDEGQRSRYETALAGLGISPAMFDRFEFWYAAIGLSTLPLMQDGYSPNNGVEKTLETKAQARRLPHSGLETVEYQLGLFDGLPVASQRRYLAEVVDQLPTIKAELRDMVEAWKRGDAVRLAELMNAEESDPVLTETLLTNRNRHWAGWIQGRMARPGTVFMAVGAGHLAGPGSVQEQLAAVGLKAERVQ